MTTHTAQIRKIIRESGISKMLWTNKYDKCRTVKADIPTSLVDFYNTLPNSFAHLHPDYDKCALRNICSALYDYARLNKIEIEIKWIDRRLTKNPMTSYTGPISFIVRISN